MHRFKQAYECGDLNAYALLFTMDFEFESNDPEFLNDYPQGLDRDAEIEAARNLFQGITRADGRHLPLAVHIDLQIDPLTIGADPEMGGVRESYRLATAGAIRLIIDQGEGASIVSIGDRHQFFLVRGEVADLGPDQRGDADHWYIRKWIEHVHFVPAMAQDLHVLHR
jgi:hypothetical protein